MLSLIKKEVSGFFSSIVGYITIIIFLLSIGLFMWVIPGETNVFDVGFSDLGFLFINAPAIFLFLIPAITMRLFAEERRMQTLELLLTKPITDFQIVLAKFLAGIFLLLEFTLKNTLFKSFI